MRFKAFELKLTFSPLNLAVTCHPIHALHKALGSFAWDYSQLEIT